MFENLYDSAALLSQHAPLLLLLGTAATGVWYSGNAMANLSNEIKKLDEKITEKFKVTDEQFKVTDEKIKVTDEKISSVSRVTDEKISSVSRVTDEKISSVRHESELKALTNTLKYNKSEEFQSIQSRQDNPNKN